MQRREILKLAMGGVVMATFAPLFKFSKAIAADAVAKIEKTKEEWKKKLTNEQYNILREEGTERPFTSKLLDEHREGVFACVGCELPLFNSNTKFDSGTGWPSFFDAIPGHLGTTTDYKLLYPRTEYHCASCGGHHGHIFEDGPKPTGLRYCSNGVVLTFIPKNG